MKLEWAQHRISNFRLMQILAIAAGVSGIKQIFGGDLHKDFQSCHFVGNASFSIFLDLFDLSNISVCETERMNAKDPISRLSNVSLNLPHLTGGK